MTAALTDQATGRICGPCSRGQHAPCDGPNEWWGDCVCHCAQRRAAAERTTATQLTSRASRVLWMLRAERHRDTVLGRHPQRDLATYARTYLRSLSTDWRDQFETTEAAHAERVLHLIDVLDPHLT